MYSVARKKANLELVLRDFDLIVPLAREIRIGTIDHVKIPVQWDLDRSKASVTLRAKKGLEAPPDADFAADEFGGHANFERGCLLEILTMKIQRSRSVGFANYDPVALQLCQSDEHRVPQAQSLIIAVPHLLSRKAQGTITCEQSANPSAERIARSLTAVPKTACGFNRAGLPFPGSCVLFLGKSETPPLQWMAA